MKKFLKQTKLIAQKKENIKGIQYDFMLNLGNETEICKCKININEDYTIWTISSWFVKKEYQNKGIGKYTLHKSLKNLVENYGIPQEIKYIWNGTNNYVLEWLETNFDAICECPIAIQKTSTEDDCLSHIYGLNIKKVFNYFEIVKK